jgi:pimeloyl-ACP methyl ester carboxylesterase
MSGPVRFDYPEHYLTVDGMAVRYWDVGDGGPLLLVHGMGVCVETWAWNVGALSARHRVLALDLPGCGKSSRPDRAEVFSLRYGGEFLRQFAEALGVPTLDVAGSSLGGALALQLSLAHPEMVRRLILVDSGGLGKEVHWLVRAIRAPWMDRILAHPPRFLVRETARQVLHSYDAAADELVGRINEHLHAPGTIASARKMAEAGVDRSGQIAPCTAAELARVAAPTLVIWGEDDQVIPARHAENAVRAIPDCRAVVLAGAGHAPQIDRAELFNALVLEFLATDRLAWEDASGGRRVMRM